MQNFFIKPHTGVDEIKFGMKRADIRSMLLQIEAEEYGDFDFYTFYAVYYNDENLCEAVLIHNFSDIEEYGLILENVDLFQLTYSQLKVFFTEIDDEVEISDDEIVSGKYGLKVNSKEDSDFKDQVCESVYIYNDKK